MGDLCRCFFFSDEFENNLGVYVLKLMRNEGQFDWFRFDF